MKKVFIVALVILALLAVFALALFLVRTFAKTQNPVPTSSFPTSSSIPSQTTGQSGSGAVSITATDGTVYHVPAFPEDVKSYALPSGTYYQLTNNIETEGSNAQFDIQYGTDNSIQITLVKEPLKDARLAAEASLRTFFPLTDQQLCSLNIDIGVPVSVNSALSGRNLGLSFCPGSVALP